MSMRAYRHEQLNLYQHELLREDLIGRYVPYPVRLVEAVRNKESMTAVYDLALFVTQVWTRLSNGALLSVQQLLDKVPGAREAQAGEATRYARVFVVAYIQMVKAEPAQRPAKLQALLQAKANRRYTRQLRRDLGPRGYWCGPVR